MTNLEFWPDQSTLWKRFYEFCSKHGKPGSGDCVGCPLYPLSLGKNSCYTTWINSPVDADTPQRPIPEHLPQAMIQPWSFHDVKQRIGKIIDYRRPNSSEASYMILGVYRAQNGHLSVLICGDAIPVEKLAANPHYTLGGNRCGNPIGGKA